jgi:hypothetical protein
METDLVSNLLVFLKEEKIKMELRKTSDSEFWLESPDGSLTAKFVMDNKAHKILYDVYSTEYYVHLKEETVRDVETLDFIAEEHRKWKLEKAVENMWLVLDEIKFWAQKNKFEIKETEMI